MLVVIEYVLAIPQQLVCLQQKLREVDNAAARASLLVRAVDADHLSEPEVALVVQVRGPKTFVLACIDVVLRLLGRPLGLVQIEIPQDPAQAA